MRLLKATLTLKKTTFGKTKMQKHALNIIENNLLENEETLKMLKKHVKDLMI